MKVLFLSMLAVFGVVFDGSRAAAEFQSALVIPVTSIIRDPEYIKVQFPQTKEGDRSEKAGLLTFFFQIKPELEEQSLFEDATKRARAVYVVDGTNLLAECIIAGTTSRFSSEAGPCFGLILKFGSVEDAERAAGAMREDLAVSIRRRLENRRFWRL